MRVVKLSSLQCFDNRRGVANSERTRVSTVLDTAWVEACTEDSCRARRLSSSGTWSVLLLDVYGFIT